MSEIKAGRRHSATDTAVMRTIRDETAAFAAKMSACLKALGFDDTDDDGAVEADEAMDQLDENAVKAMDYASLCEAVCDTVGDALAELGLIAADGDAEDAMRPYVEAIAKDLPGDDDDGDLECLVYDKFAIAMLKGANWRIPYQVEGGVIVIADPDQWQRAEADWKLIPGASAVAGDAIKLLPDGVTIEGYAVRFGSEAEPDMSAQRDYFDADTDFWLTAWDRRPMLYHHAMDPATKAAPRIGEWLSAGVDEVGVWLKGQLDAAHRYHAAIKELARRGLLRISSDSAPHLVEREPRGTVNYVKRWPLMAASLTPTAAEPRLMPVELKAALAELGLAIDDPQSSATEVRPDATRERPDGAKAQSDGRAAALLARLSNLKETIR